MKQRRWLAVLLAAVMVLTLAACGGAGQSGSAAQSGAPAEKTAETAGTRVFTDSVGREVTVDQEITKIAVSGPLAQMVVFALAPDMLVGIALDWDKSAEDYLDTEYYNLPVLGQLYGGKGEMNLEELLSAAPQVVIDVGEPKDGIAEDLDALQEQTGIPFVHITATLEEMDKAYLALGELLGREEQAKELADYCADTYSRCVAIADGTEKVNMLYVCGEEGLNVIAKGSYHAEVMDKLANNLAEVSEPSSLGTGNEVDMEQILKWNPDVVLFAPGSIYGSVGENENWKNVTAIRNGNYYEVPMGPYNWMGFPPSVQRLLGMLWMDKVLYPDAADYDLYEETVQYFKLFYHCDLTKEQYNLLVANSVGK